MAAEGSCQNVIGYDSNEEEELCGGPCSPYSQICKFCLQRQQHSMYRL